MVAVALGMGATGCAPSSERSGGGGDGGPTMDGGTGTMAMDGGARPTVDAPYVEPDSACDRLRVEAMRESSNVLIVLDRSGSMVTDDGWGHVTDRWTPAVEAIQAVTTALEDRIAFGLMLFGSDNECGTGTIATPPALGSAGAIADALAGRPASVTGGGTPTASSLLRARDALMGLEGRSHVLLVTDGAPNCNAALDGRGCRCTAASCINSGNCLDDIATVDAIGQLATAEIPTFVIGYGTSDWADVLDAMASAGATGLDTHLAVEDRATLEATLSDIAESIVSCTFELDSLPEDLDYVRVSIDDATVPRTDDPSADGWRRTTTTTVELQGDACATLRDGNPHGVEIVVECRPVIY